MDLQVADSQVADLTADMGSRVVDSQEVVVSVEVVDSMVGVDFTAAGAVVMEAAGTVNRE
jgi:hypothetical protein